jgi:hypothetical protein
MAEEGRSSFSHHHLQPARQAGATTIIIGRRPPISISRQQAPAPQQANFPILLYVLVRHVVRQYRKQYHCVSM